MDCLAAFVRQGNGRAENLNRLILATHVKATCHQPEAALQCEPQTLCCARRWPLPEDALSRQSLRSSKLEDPWLAVDKLEHFVACTAIVLIVYWACSRSFGHWLSLVCGFLLSIVAAGLKEFGDSLQWWPGHLSLRDFAADIAGTALATAVILCIRRLPTVSSSLKRLRTALTEPSYTLVATSDVEMGAAADGAEPGAQ